MRISDWSSDVCSSDLEWPHTTEWVRSGGGFYQGASVAGTRWQHRSPWATAQVQVRHVWRLRTAMTDEEGHHRSQRDEASIAQAQPNGLMAPCAGVQWALCCATHWVKRSLVFNFRSEERRVGKECFST